MLSKEEKLKYIAKFKTILDSNDITEDLTLTFEDVEYLIWSLTTYITIDKDKVPNNINTVKDFLNVLGELEWELKQGWVLKKD